MKNNLRVLAGCLAVLTALLLSSCRSEAGGESEASKSEVPVNVQFDPNKHVTVTMTFSVNEIGGNEVLEELAALYPSIEVKVEPMSNGDTKLLAMIAAGNGPDIIRASAFEELPSLVNRGLLMPLDAYIASTGTIQEDDLFEVNDLFKFDGLNVGIGPRYGIVKDWSIDSCLWLNKQAFKDAGLELPSATEPITYDKLAEYAKKLTIKEGDTVKRFGLVTINPLVSLVENYLASSGKSMWTEDFGSSTLLSEDTKAAINYWKDLQMNGYMASTLYTAQDMSPVAVSEGKAAMSMCGYWIVGQFRSTNTEASVLDNLAFAPSPIAEGGKSVNSTLTATGAGIFSGTKNPNEAYLVWEYIMANKKSVEKRASLGWGLPAFKSAYSQLPSDSVLEQQALEVTSYQVEHMDATPRVNPFILYTGLTSTFDKNYNLVLYGKTDLDSALKTIDEDLKYLIEEGKSF